MTVKIKKVRVVVTRYTLWALNLFALGTLLGFGGASFWLCDLVAQFRLHFVVILPFCLGLALWVQAWRTGMIVMVALLANLGAVLLLARGLEQVEAAPAEQVAIKVATLNLHADNTAYTEVQGWIRQSAPDILMLDEYTATWQSQLDPAALGYPYSLTKPRTDNFGIALYSRWPLRQAHVALIGQDQVPSLVAIAETPLGDVRVVATHPPPPIRSWLARLRNQHILGLIALLRSSSLPVIVAGDFNATPWSYPLSRLRADLELKGGTLAGTWPAALPSQLALPIDHVFARGDLKLTQYAVGANVGSDHYPVEASFTRP